MRPVKTALCIALLAALTLSVTPLAMAATPDTVNSESNIQFKAGQIIINPDPDPGEVGFEPMTINFGERLLPIRQETYYADGTADSAEGVDQGGGLSTSPTVGILVNDSRAKTQMTGWRYKVKLSQYMPTDSRNTAFDATLFLRSGQAFTNAGQSKIGTALVLENNGSFTIPTSNNDVLVMSATQALGMGSHGASWTSDNISLQLGEGGTPTGFDVLTNDSYKATMTWTLETTNN